MNRESLHKYNLMEKFIIHIQCEDNQTYLLISAYFILQYSLIRGRLFTFSKIRYNTLKCTNTHDFVHFTAKQKINISYYFQ